MAAKLCAMCVLVFLGAAWSESPGRVKNVHIDAFKQELDEVFSELEREIEKEMTDIEKLTKTYLIFCGDNSSTSLEDTDLENDAWNLKQITSRCHRRIGLVQKQARTKKFSFQSQEEGVQIETELDNIIAEVNKLNKELADRAKVNHNGVEDTRLDVFYLTHLDHNSLNYLVTKSPWRPKKTLLRHKKLKLRISGCPNWIMGCYIEDVAAVDDDSFVVTYTNQSYIHHFNAEGRLLSEFKFPWNLGGVALINKTHIVVGVPEKKAFIVLEVLGSLRVKSHIFMDTDCGSEIDTLNDGFIMVCHDGETSSIREYSNAWRLQKVTNSTKSTLLAQIHHEEETKMPNHLRIRPKSPRGAIWDAVSRVWYMVSPLTHEVQKVRQQGLTKRTIFYVRKPTSIALLQKRREMVIGTEKGFIYIASV